jgi:hypothetical protein
MKEFKANHNLEPNWPDVDFVETLMEHCHPSVTRRDKKAVAETQRQLERDFGHYLYDLGRLDVVSGVVIGWSRDDRPGGYIWNVYANDYQPGQGGLPPFRRLNDLTSQLKRELADVIWLRIAHVSPSDVDEVRRLCEEQNLHTERLNFPLSFQAR